MPPSLDSDILGTREECKGREHDWYRNVHIATQFTHTDTTSTVWHGALFLATS